MTVGYILLILFLVVVAYLFIYVTARINSLDEITRNKSSEIDGGLWDRAFQLSKLADILNEKGIRHELEVIDYNAFGIGMPSTLQAANSEKLDVQDLNLRELLKTHTELISDEEFKTHLDKFNAARKDLFKASLEYNKCANTYNTYISHFPGSFMAMFHKKNSKNLFGYYFRELDEQENIL